MNNLLLDVFNSCLDNGMDHTFAVLQDHCNKFGLDFELEKAWVLYEQKSRDADSPS
jgi:hypothetical protein